MDGFSLMNHRYSPNMPNFPTIWYVVKKNSKTDELIVSDKGIGIHFIYTYMCTLVEMNQRLSPNYPKELVKLTYKHNSWLMMTHGNQSN